jgi:Mrp family chromosome partitioning ATPase
MEVDHQPKSVQQPIEEDEKFDELIKFLRSRYEYVIIDCPPILPVTDAAIISTRADGCILVVHAGVTKRPHFYGTRDAILAVGSEILGVVINKIPQNAVDYEYGYRYGYSGYYGSYYRPNKKATTIPTRLESRRDQKVITTSNNSGAECQTLQGSKDKIQTNSIVAHT